MRPLPVGLACLLSLACSPARPAEPDVDRIRRDWQARYETTIDFVYRLRGEVISPPGSLVLPGDPEAPKSIQDTGYPREELRQATERAWLVDLKGGKFRQDCLQLNLNVETLEHSRKRVIEAFDGERIWTGSPDTLRFTPRKPDRVGWLFGASDLPVFLAHGLYPTSPETPDDLLAATVDRFELTPIGTEVVDGRTCEVVEVRPKDDVRNNRHAPRLYVDPERQSAVVRVESFFNGNFFGGGPNPVLASRTDVSYREHEGRWLPHRWVTEKFDHATNAQGGLSIPRGRAEYGVENIRINAGIHPAHFAPAIELFPSAAPARREPIEAPRP